MKCEILRSSMISYRSLLYITTAMYDRQFFFKRAVDEQIALLRLKVLV